MSKRYTPVVHRIEEDLLTENPNLGVDLTFGKGRQPTHWPCEIALLWEDRRWTTEVCEIPNSLGEGASDKEITTWWLKTYRDLPQYRGLAEIMVYNVKR